MQYQGVLKKMKTENGDEIQYYLDMKTDFINMNQLLNKEISISFIKYECCHGCYINYVEGREKRWKTGWRPKENK